MESDGKKDYRFPRILGQIFGPGQVFFPGTFVQSVQQDDGFVAFFFAGRGEDGIGETLVFLNMIVGYRTEFGAGKSLLKFVDLAGSDSLGKAKRYDLQMAVCQISFFIIRKKTVELLCTNRNIHMCFELFPAN